MDKELNNALNEQLNFEYFSAYIYLAMSIACREKGLDGFGRSFMVQYHDEMAHVMKIQNHLVERDGKVELLAIDKPTIKGETLLEMFKQVYEHEQEVTRRIHNLSHMAHDKKDKATELFLDWYVTEQIEEEVFPKDIIQKLKLVGEDNTGILFLDKEMGQRTTAGVQVDFSQPIQ